jgi:hypothetical protein
MDAARVAQDQVSTLIMASSGGVASGVKSHADPRRIRAAGGLLGAFQRGGSGYSLDDQLRRARVAIKELDQEMDRLDAPQQLLFALNVPERDVWNLGSWIAPTLESAGSKRSLPGLTEARERIGVLSSALTALDGRIRLALLRMGN